MKAYRSYEDYDTSASHYDSTRSAIGVEILLGVLAASKTRLGDMSILDVGCGTGNYLAALRPYLKDLIGLEYSTGMLGQAVGKLESADPVHLVRGSAFGLPFAAQRFDAVMFNQVVHHFDEGGSEPEDFPMLQLALGEAHRVLRPGGTILFNHSMHRQIRDGFWWMELIPGGMKRLIRRFIPLPALRQLLDNSGFVGHGSAIPLDAVLQSKGYFDPRSPLDESWRRGDSVWTLAGDDETRSGLDRLRTMIESGSVKAWLDRREELRGEVGQCVYVWARRSAQ